jgi:hypothetical protein
VAVSQANPALVDARNISPVIASAAKQSSARMAARVPSVAMGQDLMGGLWIASLRSQ